MPIALRKGVRSCTQHLISNFVSLDLLSLAYRAFVVNLDQVQVPSSINEGFQNPKWKTVAFDEIQALETNNTWHWQITELPPGKHAGCKWIFTAKHKDDVSIERFKARLVARGYTQTHVIAYQETFAPVAMLNMVRVLLSFIENLDWSVYQLDVKNAFLNEDLEKEIYMNIPLGFESETTVNKVCRLISHSMV